MFDVRSFHATVGLSVAILATVGCQPPPATVSRPPGATHAQAASDATVGGNSSGTTKSSNATSPAHAPGDGPAAHFPDGGSSENGTALPPPAEVDSHESSSAEQPSAEDLAEIRFGHFNRKKPVLFTSGYEEDNQSCMVCHIDFAKELISSVHLENDITCHHCHGDSEVHRADEYNIHRPDVIWGRAEIPRFCGQCHAPEDHPKGKKFQEFFAKWEDKRRPNGRWVAEDSVCTDCHGNHAITVGEGTFK